MRSLVPIGDHVVIQQVKKEVKSAGGIILQNSPYENVIEGVVVSVGEGRLTNDNTLVKMRVRPGDRVLYHEFAATNKVVEDGETYHIMQEGDVFGVLPAN